MASIVQLIPQIEAKLKLKFNLFEKNESDLDSSRPYCHN